jgi:hypothetical protein
VLTNVDIYFSILLLSNIYLATIIVFCGKYHVIILVEQELFTLPEHPSSPRFLMRFVLLDLLFYVYVL